MDQHIEQLIKTTKLDSLDQNQSLNFLKEKTGLRPSQLALVILVFLLVVLIISEASSLIVAIGCFIIPAYFSFLSLETPERQDDVKYLTYWVVFSLSEVLSPLLYWILGGTIYTVVRIAITLLLLHPQLNLAQKLYYDFISPIVMRHEDSIDRKISKFSEKGKDKFDQIAQKGKKQMNEFMKKNL